MKYKTSKIEGRFFYQTFGLKLYAENSDVNEIIMKEQGNDKATGINNGYSKEVIEKQLTLIECSHRGRYAGVYSEV